MTKSKKTKSLKNILSKNAGRNVSGKITTRHRGGRQKRYYRDIDFKRDNFQVEGEVVAFEYDPNRNVDIALVHFADGDKRYILKPHGISLGSKVVSDKKAEIKPGNALPLSEIPVGTQIHNLEINPKGGGKVVRSAGTSATLLAKEEKYAQIKLPSGEVRKFLLSCFATVGQLSNIKHRSQKLGKAGRKRLMGKRPTVRGSAQNPSSHPHGGGEGRSGEGRHPKTPWGKKARGKKTRKKGKHSDKLIISRK